MAGIRHNLPDVMQDFDVLQGETDNILKAALRDIGGEVKDHVQANWPIDTGKSHDGFELEEGEGVRWDLVNDVEYVEHVWSHPNQGGPPALIDKLLDDAVDAIGDDPELYISDRVRQLLRKRAP